MRERFGLKNLPGSALFCLFLISCLAVLDHPPKMLTLSIYEFGAMPTDGHDDSFALANAVEYLSRLGGGTLVIPAGEFIVNPESSWHGYIFFVCRMADNVRVRGQRGRSVLKFPDRVSTDEEPKRLAVFFSDAVVENFSLDGITFDFNGAENPTGGTVRPHAALMFAGMGRGNGVVVTNCVFRHCAGSNIILTSCAQDSPAYVMGRRWKIAGNRFVDNGLSAWDFSAIWAWADDVEILNNIFEETTMSPPGRVKCAAELHGGNQTFRGNVVRNYSLGNWVAPNFTTGTFNVLLEGNIYSPVRGFGICFYRAIQSEAPISGVVIRRNRIFFERHEPALPYMPALRAGVLIRVNFRVSDVLIERNTVAFRSSPAPTYMTFITSPLPGEEHLNLTIRDNRLVESAGRDGAARESRFLREKSR